MNRAKMEKIVWESTHQHFRGNWGGALTILVDVPGKGATPKPLRDFTDGELVDRIRRSAAT